LRIPATSSNGDCVLRDCPIRTIGSVPVYDDRPANEIASAKQLEVLVDILESDPLDRVFDLYGAGAGLAINAGWRIACPFSTLWHALGAHGAAILGALIGRVLGNRRLHIGGRRS